MATIQEAKIARSSQSIQFQSGALRGSYHNFQDDDHDVKMEEITGGRLPESYSPINKNLKASPYSILRKSDEQEVQATMDEMRQRAVAANHGGNRTTRTELLRQLALK